MTEIDRGATAPRYQLMRTEDQQHVRWHIWKADRIASLDTLEEAEQMVARLKLAGEP